MNHFATPSFWGLFEKLPTEIKEIANKNYEILKKDSRHPSLHLKKINKYWSVRVGKNYRALAVEVEKDLVWFWIGKHSEYDRLIK